MSAKKKLTTLLPELAKISVYQSNSVTTARRDYTMMQERIFTWVMYNMQADIKKVMNGTPVEQLRIFSPELESDVVWTKIPLAYLGRSDQYRDIRDSVEKLATISVKMKNKEKGHQIITGLFSAIQVPDEGKRSSDLILSMRRDVAAMLMHIDRERGLPARYTSFSLFVTAQCKNKYTSILYKLLCSKRDLGGWRVPYSELRDILQIDNNSYKNYYDFKKRVLIPVSKELQKLGDIYFKSADSNMETLDGKKVVAVNFKIIRVKAVQGVTVDQKQNILNILKTTFGLSPTHCDKLQPIFHEKTEFTAILEKIEYLRDWCRDNQVTHKAAYAVTTMLKEFKQG